MSFGDSLNLGVGDALQSITNALGITNSVKNQTGGNSNLPWSLGGTTPSKSAFFKPIAIDSSRWNQLFPYRLMVIDVSNKNSVVGGSVGSATKQIGGTTYQVVTGGPEGTTLISFAPIVNNWIFSLPITPQQLNITDQFAINTTATLRGVLEEHNGVKFKMINASGTMGVWPGRESVTKPPTTPGLIQSFFGGTLNAVTSLASSVNSVINTATGNSAANKPVTVQPEVSTAGPSSTAYYQALALEQFLEQYAEAKKLPANAGWRLVFDIPKQNQSFICTPMQYVWQQNVNKPIEIQYSMQFKAWRRIDLTKTAINSLPNIAISPGLLQRVLNTITAAQTACSAAINVIGSVTSDVNTIFNVLRQTALLIKDLAGVAIAAGDLPTNIAQDFQSAISTFVFNNQNTFLSQTTDPKTTAQIKQINGAQQQNEGISLNAVNSGQLGAAAVTSNSLNPVNAIFSNANANYALLSLVPVASLALTAAQRNAVTSLVTAASQTTVSQLQQYRAVILSLALQLSNSFGAGSAYYDQVYNLPPPANIIQPMTLDQYDLLQSLYDTMQAYDSLTATTALNDINVQTSMEYVAGLANVSGIVFDNSISKTIAPVPYGLSIEGISLRYLGDPQRWLEIVTLNNLREPYIDESGFQIPLLSNGTGRQVTVGDASNLYIGQSVILMSSTQIPSTRTILGIDTLSSTTFLVTLDGLANLGNFVIADGAYVQAYLPGTVNSQQKIFIPSDLPIDEAYTIIPPSSTISDPLTGLSLVDWLLTSSGDVAVNNYGDVRYSSGMTNIMQAMIIKLSTQTGKWLLHPEFGINLAAGKSVSDMDMQQIFNAINNLVIQDSRFQGISSLQIVLNGPTITIGLGVLIANQSGVFPLTFVLQ
jgi:hypothetical protein